MRKLFKVFLSLILTLTIVVSLTACDNNKEYGFSTVSKEDLKVGLICLHDKSSTYDDNFITAFENAMNSLYDGNATEAQKHYEIVTNVPEGEDCYTKASELAKTCNIIFADSFGHEPYMIKAASENPTVRFCHATGTKAHTYALANYSNAFADIYEGRFLAGFAAGLKLMEMKTGCTASSSLVWLLTHDEVDVKIGYVGAFPYAEVVSGYTAFYLGVKAAYNIGDVEMEVMYTNSWYDETAEKEAAKTLINNGCELISQHADSMGAPNACNEKNVPNVTYNVSTQKECSGTYVAYSRINWEPYYLYAIGCTMEGIRIAADWSGNLESGSVEFAISDANGMWIDKDAISMKLNLVKLGIETGTVNVFDLINEEWKVNGTYTSDFSSYLADVNDFGDYVSESKVIVNNIFKESEYRSAPYFDIRIKGITELSENN